MRFARITLGLLLTLAGLAATIAGALAAFWLIGPDNTISTPARHLTSPGLAVVSAPDLLDRHGPTLHLTASGSKPLFVGVAQDLDVRNYLAGTAHTRLIRFDPPGTFGTQEMRGKSNKLTPPGDLDWWVAKSAPGSQAVAWPIADGRYDVVVMNADGTPAVGAQVTFGIQLHRSFGISLLVLGAGVAIFALGLTLTIRRRPVATPDAVASPIPATARIPVLVSTAPTAVIHTPDEQTTAPVTLPPHRLSPFAPDRISPFAPLEPTPTDRPITPRPTPLEAAAADRPMTRRPATIAATTATAATSSTTSSSTGAGSATGTSAAVDSTTSSTAVGSATRNSAGVGSTTVGSASHSSAAVGSTPSSSTGVGSATSTSTGVGSPTSSSTTGQSAAVGSAYGQSTAGRSTAASSPAVSPVRSAPLFMSPAAVARAKSPALIGAGSSGRHDEPSYKRPTYDHAADRAGSADAVGAGAGAGADQRTGYDTRAGAGAGAGADRPADQRAGSGAEGGSGDRAGYENRDGADAGAGAGAGRPADQRAGSGAEGGSGDQARSDNRIDASVGARADQPAGSGAEARAGDQAGSGERVGSSGQDESAEAVEPDVVPLADSPEFVKSDEAVRRTAALLASGALLLTTTSCGLMPPKNSLAGPESRPAVTLADAQAVVVRYNQINNQANQSRDPKLSETIEADPTLAQTRAGFVIGRKLDAAGKDKSKPFTYTDPEIGAPQFTSYPMRFVVSSGVSDSADSRQLGVWQRASAGSPWLLTHSVYPSKSVDVPSVDGLRTPDSSDLEKLQAQPKTVAKDLAAYLTGGAQAPQAKLFVPSPGTAKLLELRAKSKLTDTAETYIASVTDTFQPSGDPLTFITSSGDALVFLSFTEQYLQRVEPGSNAYWTSGEATAFSSMVKYTQSLHQDYLHQVALVIPSKATGGATRVLSIDAQLVGAGGA